MQGMTRARVKRNARSQSQTHTHTIYIYCKLNCILSRARRQTHNASTRHAAQRTTTACAVATQPLGEICISVVEHPGKPEPAQLRPHDSNTSDSLVHEKRARKSSEMHPSIYIHIHNIRRRQRHARHPYNVIIRLFTSTPHPAYIIC